MTVLITSDLHGYIMFSHYMKQWIKCDRNPSYFTVYMLSLGWTRENIQEMIKTLSENQFQLN